jgi:hypothetical protein
MKDVDARDAPGHDVERACLATNHSFEFGVILTTANGFACREMANVISATVRVHVGSVPNEHRLLIRQA